MLYSNYMVLYTLVDLQSQCRGRSPNWWTFVLERCLKSHWIGEWQKRGNSVCWVLLHGICCTVTRTHSTFGDRAFAVAGPGLWNRISLQWIPAVAKDISVWIVGPRSSVNCINCTSRNICTYLLSYYSNLCNVIQCFSDWLLQSNWYLCK